MKQIYLGGRVFTGALPLQQAFIVEDGRFAAVGTDEEMRALAAPQDEVIPLEGRFVCPGFIDSHMHVLSYGNARQGCDLAAATRSLGQLQQALRDFIASRPMEQDAWVLGRGWNQDYFTPATGMPTRWDLDAVTQEQPVCIVRCCGHCLVVNSRALALLGIDESTPAPEGGSIERDAQGRLSGVFCDTAMSLVQSRIPAPGVAQIKEMLLTGVQALSAMGVTSCHTDDLCSFEQVPWQDVIAAYHELEAEGRLSVRIYEQSQFPTPQGLQEFLDSGYNTGVGTEMFRIGPLKILGDGSLGARTAFMSRAYADAPEEKGLAIFTQEQFNALITLARSRGMQVAVHAIGDGILDRVLDAYALAFGQYPAQDHRCGVIHIQLTRPDQLRRVKEMNLLAYAQHIFIDYDSHIVRQRAGEELAASSYAFRTMREMGVPVSNGTDCPVEDPNPMRGVQCAVTRQPLDFSLPPYRPEERMSVEEILQAYTAQGAYASFEEDFKGRIAPGMAADFVVLSENPFDVPPQALSAIRALQTVLGGRTVYKAE